MRLVNANKLRLLAISIGIIYLWFGILKFFPNLSPAETLASNTIHVLSFKLISPKMGCLTLAVMEVIVGLGMIIGWRRSIFVKIALGHMFFTFTPLIIYPDLSFTAAPYGFTIIGQYIMKNIVIIMALFMLLPAKKPNLNLIQDN